MTSRNPWIILKKRKGQLKHCQLSSGFHSFEGTSNATHAFLQSQEG